MAAAHVMTADAIRWTLAPTARPERLPERLLVALTDSQLRDYTLDLQSDLEAVRLTLHEALAALHDLTERHHRQTERYHALLARGRVRP